MNVVGGVGQTGGLGLAAGNGAVGGPAASGQESQGVIQALLQALPALQSSMQNQSSMGQTASQVNGILGMTLGGIPQGSAG